VAGSWTFANPVRVLFGAGRLGEIASLVDTPTLVVTTSGASRRRVTDRLDHLLDRPMVDETVTPNPTIGEIEAVTERWRGRRIRTIVGLGGGSAIDMAKVLSLTLPNPDVDVRRLAEGIEALDAVAAVPVVAIPTTAGTGSEVTPTATVWDDVAPRKLAVASPLVYPRAAIVDPELTLSMPWEVTLSSGLDALSQSFEAICNRNATPVTTSIAERAVGLIPDALRALRHSPHSLQHRRAMAEAALLSGLSISQTRTGLAHSMSYPITAHTRLPHGLACALALPGVIAYNAADGGACLRGVATRLGLSTDRFATWLEDLYRDLDVADAIRPFVPDLAAVVRLVPEMITPGRADNNPRAATEDDLRSILYATERWFTDG
jgi:alcohol dehydrogenase